MAAWRRLIAELQLGHDMALAQQALEAMTTHETLFFRDRMVFEHFRSVLLPKLIELRASTRKLRIWCAAVSTGQEAYSLAMILDDEAKKLQGWNIDILGTDLSHRTIDIARNGVYSQFEVQRGLPINYLLRYFRRQEESWRLAEPIKARVQFRPQNLLSDFSKMGMFDVILCRNVLMYFDPGCRSNVLAKLAGKLAPDGYLVLGSTENIAGASPDIVPVPFQSAMGMKRAADKPKLRLVAG